MCYRELYRIQKNKVYSKFSAYNDYLCSRFPGGDNTKPVWHIKSVYKLFLGMIVRFVGIIHCCKFRSRYNNENRILVLPGCSQNEDRLRPVLERLRNHGADIYIDYQNTYGYKKGIVAYGYVPIDVPHELLMQYSEAAFLLQKYQPKIVLFMQNSGLLPAIIKSISDNISTINISHGITYSDKSFSMFDYDYYFMFGRSSLYFTRKNYRRFGTTKIVLAGSPFISSHIYNMSEGKIGQSIVYFSQWLAPEFSQEIEFSNKIVCEYAFKNKNRKILIKLHPLEDGHFWKNIAATINNIEIINGEESLSLILNKSSLSLIAWSNAAIESTLAARPLVAIDQHGRAEEYLHVRDFFPVVDSVESLESAIKSIESSYTDYIIACRSFVNQHVERTHDAQDFVTNKIMKILEGIEIEGELIEENFNW